MKPLTKRLGLTGIVLGGALELSALSGCVSPPSQADQLYNQGVINQQQHAIMKSQEQAQEQQRNQALTFAILGMALGYRGIQVGNPQAVFVGDSMVKMGAAQAGASNTNVYVGGNNTNSQQTNAPNPQPQAPLIEMPAYRIAEDIKEGPLVIRKNYADNRDVVAEDEVDWSIKNKRKNHSRPDGEFVAVVSNYCIDFNKNGTFDYPSEYCGLKEKFLSSESVTLSLVSKKPAEKLEIKLLDSKGAEIDSVKGGGLKISKQYEDKFSCGSYSARFYANGEDLGMLRFEVVNNKWEFNVRK